jgi:hypothetical protein
MKINWSVVTLVAFLFTGASAGADSDGRHRLGGGAHYWRTIDEIDAVGFDVDEDAIGWMISYQYVPSLLKLELDLELLPEDFAGIKDTTLAPQALLLIGAGLYGGLGIGTFVTDGKFADDPYFIVRAGIELELLPSIYLDINANYHFTDFDSISQLDENVDTDTVTLGAMLRFAL